jgi:hypothetical protein
MITRKRLVVTLYVNSFVAFNLSPMWQVSVRVIGIPLSWILARTVSKSPHAAVGCFCQFMI